MTHETRFCLRCWLELRPRASRCPGCGASSSERIPYREALELALESPIGPTAQRAAYLLGKLASPASIRALRKALAGGDPIVAAEAVEALALIDSTDAREAVEGARRHRFVTVRSAAARALGES